MAVFNTAVFYLYACRLRKYHNQTWPGWQCFKLITYSRVRQYLRLYVPGVVQAASELWRFQLLNAWSGLLGVTQAAAQSSAFRTIFMGYVFVGALAAGTST